MNFKKLAICIMAFGLFVLIGGGVRYLSNLPLEYKPKKSSVTKTSSPPKHVGKGGKVYYYGAEIWEKDAPGGKYLQESNDRMNLSFINMERAVCREGAKKTISTGLIITIVGLVIFVSAKKEVKYS